MFPPTDKEATAIAKSNSQWIDQIVISESFHPSGTITPLQIRSTEEIIVQVACQLAAKARREFQAWLSPPRTAGPDLIMTLQREVWGEAGEQVHSEGLTGTSRQEWEAITVTTRSLRSQTLVGTDFIPRVAESERRISMAITKLESIESEESLPLLGQRLQIQGLHQGTGMGRLLQGISLLHPSWINMEWDRTQSVGSLKRHPQIASQSNQSIHKPRSKTLPEMLPGERVYLKLTGKH